MEAAPPSAPTVRRRARVTSTTCGRRGGRLGRGSPPPPGRVVTARGPPHPAPRGPRAPGPRARPARTPPPPPLPPPRPPAPRWARRGRPADTLRPRRIPAPSRRAQRWPSRARRVVGFTARWAVACNGDTPPGGGAAGPSWSGWRVTSRSPRGRRSSTPLALLPWIAEGAERLISAPADTEDASGSASLVHAALRGRPRTRKAPPNAGLFPCAEEDSNLHGPFSPQGPQPCASTNSATGAGGAAAAAADGGEYSPRLIPSWPPATFSNTCSLSTSRTAREAAHGLDQAPAGDLRLHQALLGQVRLPTDRARHRQGRRARVLVDRPRSSREPRAARPPAPRPDEAARDRAARPRTRRGRGGGRDGRGQRAQRRAAGPAARGARRGRPADPRRGEHRGLRQRAADRRRRRGRVRAARAGPVDEGHRDPRGRLRRRAPPGDRKRRRDRRRAGGRGGDREALLPRGRPRAPAARERFHGADPLEGRARPGAGGRPFPQRVMTTLTLDLFLDAPTVDGSADPHDGGGRDPPGGEPPPDAPPAP